MVKQCPADISFDHVQSDNEAEITIFFDEFSIEEFSDEDIIANIE